MDKRELLERLASFDDDCEIVFDGTEHLIEVESVSDLPSGDNTMIVLKP